MKELIDKTTKLIIESIHDLPYEDAIKKEKKCDCDNGNIHSFWSYTSPKAGQHKGTYDCDACSGIGHIPLPITIGRVMQAVANKEKLRKNNREQCFFDMNGAIMNEDLLLYWKLTKKNGEECNLEDQSKETIEFIYNLFKQ